MKKIQVLLAGLLFFLTLQFCFSQEVYRPYTAKAYWDELNRIEYRQLKMKQVDNGILTNDEKKWLDQYEEYLGEYFETLSSAEKEIFYEKKEEWYSQAGIPENGNSDDL